MTYWECPLCEWDIEYTDERYSIERALKTAMDHICEHIKEKQDKSPQWIIPPTTVTGDTYTGESFTWTASSP